ncbi:hypothetical protein V6N12_043995 [Hibiscus sabdariffa]|uniref:RNase H type-1 domain-containing protein n=1 Tax=Hibiscus sabdariffa TaxID=183260 RepID=A0ABR2DHM1_9ROSI
MFYQGVWNGFKIEIGILFGGNVCRNESVCSFGLLVVNVSSPIERGDCPTASNVWSRVVCPSKLLEFMNMPFETWLMVNLRSQGQFVSDPTMWDYLFPTIYWLMWKRRCSTILDVYFVERDDILLVGDWIASDFCRVVATHVGTRLCGFSGHDLTHRGWSRPRPYALPGNALVDDVHEMLTQDWTVIIRQIPRDMNKVVDALAVSICDVLIGLLFFDSPSDFVAHLVARNNVDDDEAGLMDEPWWSLFVAGKVKD